MNNVKLNSNDHKQNQSAINAERFANKNKAIGICRDSRKTHDLVLDQRTLNLINKIHNKGLFTNMYGCISAGKEANVYYAVKYNNNDENIEVNNKGDEKENNINIGEEEEILDVEHEIVLKIFKTSILVFKDRSAYTKNDFRFSNGYQGNNPRKKVQQWAEKEFRNLRRIFFTGIRSPLPLDLRKHVLAMSYIGEEGKTSIKLKDCNTFLNIATISRLYVETVAILKYLFYKTGLVHGDFSEYNLLLNYGHIYLIDVSQSTEANQPFSLELLKRDCFNITKFFRKKMEDYNERTQFSNESFKKSSILSTDLWDNDMASYGVQDAEKLPADKFVTMMTSYELYNFIIDKKKYNTGDESWWPEYDRNYAFKVVNQFNRSSQDSLKNQDNIKDIAKEKNRFQDNGSYHINDTLSALITDYDKLRNEFNFLCQNIHRYCNDNEYDKEKEEEEEEEETTILSSNGKRVLSEQQVRLENELLETYTPSTLFDLTGEQIIRETEFLAPKNETNYPELIPSSDSYDKDEDEDDIDTDDDDTSSTKDEKKEQKYESNNQLSESRGNIPADMCPKEWKKLIKLEKRELRKTKVKKHVKKKKDKKKK